MGKLDGFFSTSRENNRQLGENDRTTVVHDMKFWKIKGSVREMMNMEHAGNLRKIWFHKIGNGGSYINMCCINCWGSKHIIVQTITVVE